MSPFQAAFDSKQYDKTIEHANKVLSLDKTNAFGYLYGGAALENQGRGIGFHIAVHRLAS